MQRAGKGKLKCSMPIKGLMLDHYCRTIIRRNPHLQKYTEKDFRDTMFAFWNKCADILVNQPNGIVLDGVGYFAYPAYYKKARNPYTRQTSFRGDGLVYHPQFFGSVFNDFFISALHFNPALKYKRLWMEKLKEGMKYKCHIKNVKKLVGKRKKYAYHNKR